MFDNSIATIFTLMSKDSEDPFKQSENLEIWYENAPKLEKKIIDRVLINICGYSLDTIINNPEKISMEDEE